MAGGIDVVVAQGTEAGGHTGGVGTLPLLQAVVPLAREAGVPVVAAGGIATGAGIAAALAAGATGAWIGTRFAATQEALGPAAAKQRLVAAGLTDSVLTRAFDVAQGIPWPREFPGRALRNRFTDRWHGREDEIIERRDVLAAELSAARAAEDFDTAYVYAGQAAGLVLDLPAAGDLVARLAADAEAALRAATGTLA